MNRSNYYSSLRFSTVSVMRIFYHSKMQVILIRWRLNIWAAETTPFWNRIRRPITISNLFDSWQASFCDDYLSVSVKIRAELFIHGTREMSKALTPTYRNKRLLLQHTIWESITVKLLDYILSTMAMSQKFELHMHVLLKKWEVTPLQPEKLIHTAWFF